MTRFRAFLMSESPECSSGWTQTGPPVPWLPTQPVQLLLDASFTFPENIETFPKEKIEMEYRDITNTT